MNVANASSPATRSSDAEKPGQKRPARGFRQLWPMVILLYSLITPPEFQIVIGSVIFYPNRIVCLVILPWLIRRISDEGLKLHVADMLIIFAALWTFVVMIIHYGGGGVEIGGGLAFDMVVPYFIARMTIRSIEDFRRLMILFLPGLAFAATTMMLESIFKVQVIRPVARTVLEALGFSPQYIISTMLDPEQRLGLMRARGPFGHPILGGLFVGSLLPIYLKLGGRHRKQARWGAAFSLMGFFSLSSSAFLVLAASLLLVGYDWLQKRIDFLSWQRLLIGFGFFALCLELFTSGVVRFVIRYLTLNPATGYFRLLIWEYGTASVARHPFIGIGQESYERQTWMVGSVDNHWLAVAMRDGLIGAIPLYIAVIVTVVTAGRATQRSLGVTRETRLGIAIALTAIIFAGFTVFFFSSFAIWFPALLGMAITTSQPLRTRVFIPDPHARPKFPNGAALSPVT